MQPTTQCNACNCHHAGACFDWSGSTGADFDTKAGQQLRAVVHTIAALPSLLRTPDPAEGYNKSAGMNCFAGHGGVEIDGDPAVGLSVGQCEARCGRDAACGCVAYHAADRKCWKRAGCVPAEFKEAAGYDTYVRKY
jgi:hypothetical protein